MRQLHPDPQRHLPEMRHVRRNVGVFMKESREIRARLNSLSFLFER